MEGSALTGWKKRRLEEGAEEDEPTSSGDCSPPEPDEQETLNGLMERVSQESLPERRKNDRKKKHSDKPCSHNRVKALGLT
ncbi:hypothetical protein QOT17_009780 [Balamuthia mandrillaris]